MFCLLACLVLFCIGPVAAEVAYEEIKVPMAEKSLFGTRTINLSVKVYKPAGDGKYPLVIINHGSPRSSYDARNFKATYRKQSAFFVSQGFVVANPLRRGFGSSEGSRADSTGPCSNPGYYHAIAESARDIKAVVDYMKTRSFVDSSRVLLVGQSAGGAAVVAYGSLYREDIAGVINFAGGRGSNGPYSVCSESSLVSAFGEFGERASLETLWIYAEDDSYFAPDLVRAMHKAYTGEGGKAKLVISPRAGHDHKFFDTGIEVWKPLVIDYLRERKLIE